MCRQATPDAENVASTISYAAPESSRVLDMPRQPTLVLESNKVLMRSIVNNKHHHRDVAYISKFVFDGTIALLASAQRQSS